MTVANIEGVSLYEEHKRNRGRRGAVSYLDPTCELIPSDRRGHGKSGVLLHTHPSTYAQFADYAHFYHAAITVFLPGPRRGCISRYMATSIFSSSMRMRDRSQ